jgi:hypothetical protein
MITLSRHAELRCQQRGITQDLIALVFNHADVETAIGDGCTFIRVTKREARRVGGDDRLARVGLVWSGSRAQVVSVVPIRSGPAGRRYRAKH